MTDKPSQTKAAVQCDGLDRRPIPEMQSAAATPDMQQAGSLTPDQSRRASTSLQDRRAIGGTAHGKDSAEELVERLSPVASELNGAGGASKQQHHKLNELALFAGAGGGILGGKLLNWRTVCAVEINDYARRVLMARQDDGSLEPFPIWDDVTTFDGRPWRGIVDVVSGGFPCQDISAAGQGAGITGERSGLWKEMGRIVGEVLPRFVLVENSPVLTSRGLGTVLGDLAALGYDARWGVLSAADAIWLGGTPCLDHLRERIWIVATPDAARHEQGRSEQRPIGQRTRTRSESSAEHSEGGCGQGRTRGSDSGGERKVQQALQADANGRLEIEEGRADGIGRGKPCEGDDDGAGMQGTHWWQSEPAVGRVAHGVADVDRLAALGNGQVPAVAALAFRILAGGGGGFETVATPRATTATGEDQSSGLFALGAVPSFVVEDSRKNTPEPLVEQEPSVATNGSGRSGAGGDTFAVGEKVQFMSVAHRGSGVSFSTCIGTIKQFSTPHGIRALVRKRNGRDEWKRVSELRKLSAHSPVNDVFNAIVAGAGAERSEANDSVA